MKELIIIQSKLKAEKSQFNKFGNYKYRSLEDIVEALKPLMEETKTFLTLTDEIREVAGRIYIVATAILHSEDGTTTVSVNGWAREALQQKGMSDAQVTGSTSTYARKYALNGLFAIDDTKDDDSVEFINNQQVSNLNSAMSAHKVDNAKFLLHFNISHLNQMPLSSLDKAMAMIQSKKVD
jgi:hypothetical protein